MLAGVATFYPPASLLAKYLPLLGVAINGVEEARKVTGKDFEAARDEVRDHNTRGRPNSAVLS